MTPKRNHPHKNLHDLTMSERLKHSKDYQMYWYEFIAPFVKDKFVLDVGSGSGYGLPILDKYAQAVVGVDLLPLSDLVHVGSVNMFDEDSFEIITCIDVIEHVKYDEDFLESMIRVGSDAIFFTTPNYNVHRCKNPYHIREYTPSELKRLLITLDYEVYLGDDHRNITKVDDLDNDCMSSNIGIYIDISIL